MLTNKDVARELCALRDYLEGVPVTITLPDDREEVDKILAEALCRVNSMIVELDKGPDDLVDAARKWYRAVRDKDRATGPDGFADVDRVLQAQRHLMFAVESLDKGEADPWTETTWGHVAEGDITLGADGQEWTVKVGLSPTSPRTAVVVGPAGQEFTFHPAPDQPVKARRGPTGRAIETLATGFNVEVLANGSKW